MSLLFLQELVELLKFRHNFMLLCICLFLERMNTSSGKRHVRNTVIITAIFSRCCIYAIALGATTRLSTQHLLVLKAFILLAPCDGMDWLALGSIRLKENWWVGMTPLQYACSQCQAGRSAIKVGKQAQRGLSVQTDPGFWSDVL